MKRFLIISIFVALMMVCLCSCSNESESENRLTNEEYFAITELIQNGEFEQAKTTMDEAYAQIDYADAGGSQKMIHYRLYYISQNLYDDAMTVLLDYLKANDFANHLKEVPADTSPLEDNCVHAISLVKDILESVSEEKRAEAMEVIGQELLDKYETR